MLPSIKRAAFLGVGLMVTIVAGSWVGRRRQPVVVPPAVVEQESDSRVCRSEDRIPRSYSELSLDADVSPSANDSYSTFLVEQ